MERESGKKESGEGQKQCGGQVDAEKYCYCGTLVLKY